MRGSCQWQYQTILKRVLDQQKLQKLTQFWNIVDHNNNAINKLEFQIQTDYTHFNKLVQNIKY